MTRSRCSRIKWTGIVGVAALSLTSEAALAADAALIEAAKKEGTVVWYTPLIVSQTARPFANAFEKKYPGIKVELVAGTVNDLFIKHVNEAKANAVQADAAGSNPALVSDMIKSGLIEKYIPDSAADLPANLKDKNGYYASQLVSFLVPAVNTSDVKPADVPKTWNDFLNPRWKGKIAWPGTELPSGPPGLIGTLLLTMGEEPGMAYLKKLAAQQIINVPGNQRVVLDNLITGEYPVALMTYNHLAEHSAQAGAPVQWLKTAPAVELVSYAFVMKGAPHPNAGKLFVDYELSREGQTVLSKLGELPADPMVSAAIPDLKPEGGNFQAFNIPMEAYTNSQAKWIKIYNDLFR